MLTRTAIENARAHAETFFSASPAPVDALSTILRDERDATRAKTERLRLARIAIEAQRPATPSRQPRRRAA